MVPLDRQDLVILMEGGYIYLGMGKLDQALEVFEGLAVLAPDNELPWVAIGNVHFGQFRYDQAEKAYLKALKLKPESPFARAYLGEALFFKGKKEEAVRELEKAILLDPGSAVAGFARSLVDAVKKGFVPPAKVGHH